MNTLDLSAIESFPWTNIVFALLGGFTLLFAVNSLMDIIHLIEVRHKTKKQLALQIFMTVVAFMVSIIIISAAVFARY